MTESVTPNVVVTNPKVRKMAQMVLSVAGIVLSSLLVLEGNIPAVDWSAWLSPAFALYGFLAATFGLAVISPNIPGNGDSKIVEPETIVVREVVGSHTSEEALG